jgi:hypothetical protein
MSEPPYYLLPTLNTEATRFSEMSVFTRPTGRHIPADGILQTFTGNTNVLEFGIYICTHYQYLEVVKSTFSGIVLALLPYFFLEERKQARGNVMFPIFKFLNWFIALHQA